MIISPSIRIECSAYRKPNQTVQIMSQNSPDTATDLDDKLIAQLEKLTPLADSMADTFRTMILFSLGLLIWLAAYLLLQGASLTLTLVITGLAALPALILVRFWRAFEGLKELPKFAAETIDTVTDEVSENWHAVTSGKKDAMNLVGQAKNLFTVRSLLNEAEDALGHAFNITTLINPLSLIFGVLAIIGTGLLALIAFILLLLALFSG
jgi:hypothetical protein